MGGMFVLPATVDFLQNEKRKINIITKNLYDENFFILQALNKIKKQ